VNKAVLVSVSGQTSTAVIFSYNPPIINAISPAVGPTAGAPPLRARSGVQARRWRVLAGGALLNVTGASFGTGVGNVFTIGAERRGRGGVAG
jgi:hypothetical protein